MDRVKLEQVKLGFGGGSLEQPHIYWISTFTQVTQLKIWAPPRKVRALWRKFFKRYPRGELEDFLTFLDKHKIKYEVI